MDRREFLETVATGAATTPLVVRPWEAGAGSSDQQTPAQPASPEASPRRRENFNRDWRFARQSKGTGALGSFDRENGEAAGIEPRFRNGHPPEYDDSDWDAINAMGVNFWRTSHYPHDPAAMEASDRLGLMVWEELPINKEIGDPRQYTANVLVMAAETIRRHRNHPYITVLYIAL
ncbi:MAG: glycoside hydrolase family 2 TIM barrel-domain containing protein [Terriglobia bacterium]